MRDFLYMEADGKCKWQQQEDHKDVYQDCSDSSEQEDAAENAMPA